MLAKVATAFSFDIYVTLAGSGVPGLTLASFTSTVIDNGVLVAAPVTTHGLALSEVSAGSAPGWYTATVVPIATGPLLIDIRHAANTVEGGLQQLQVHTASMSDLSTILGNLGSETVTLTIEDGVAVGIVSVFVDIYDATDATPLILGLVTDTAGQVTFNLNDGSYKVRLRKAQVTFTSPEDLTVSGTTADTYVGSVSTPTPSASPDNVVIYGNLEDLGGAPLEAELKAELASSPQFAGTVGIGVAIAQTFSDDTGFFQITVKRNIVINLVAPSLGLRKKITTPDVATVELSTLI